MRQKKIEEAKVQLDNKIHNKPRRAPIVKNTQARVNEIIINLNASGQTLMTRLTNGFHKLSIRLEDQYSIRLRKQTKRIPVARPTISGFDGLKENIIF